MTDWVLIKKDYMKRIVNGEKVILSELAREHGVKPGTLRSRRHREEWDKELEEIKRRNSKSVATGNATNNKSVATDNTESNKNKTKDGKKEKEKPDTNTDTANIKRSINMLGNNNAINNKGGKGAKKGNRYNEKHGLYSNYLPDDAKEIFDSIEEIDHLDMLWDSIKIKYAAILRSQKIMYVKDQEDTTKVVTEEEISDNEFSTTKRKKYEYSFAWDKQANFLQAQSRAFSELRGLIKQYHELVNEGLATKEQKLRIKKLEAEIDVLGQDQETGAADDFKEAVINIAAKEREKTGK